MSADMSAGLPLILDWEIKKAGSPTGNSVCDCVQTWAECSFCSQGSLSSHFMNRRLMSRFLVKLVQTTSNIPASKIHFSPLHPWWISDPHSQGSFKLGRYQGFKTLEPLGKKALWQCCRRWSHLVCDSWMGALSLTAWLIRAWQRRAVLQEV